MKKLLVTVLILGGLGGLVYKAMPEIQRELNILKM